MLSAPAPSLLCPSCGGPNPPEARFCNHCGLSVGAIPRDAGTLTLTGVPMSARSLGVASTRPPGSNFDLPTDAHELADPLLGVVVAERYRLLEAIGRGGMGVVYKVEHARIGKLMALKLLTGELTRDPTQVARFKREALMASRLSHPNTVQVFDFGAWDGLVYLAMEYLKGEDLGKFIRKNGPLGVERTAKIIVQVCSSLAEAHDKGIVHRDLKPENILLVKDQEGEDVVKVLDFGLAKLRESNELNDVTSRGAIVGTPYYMSPEQIRGEDVGPQGDVYALGALAYACLTASVVFEANTPMGVLTKHLTEAPRSPSERFPDLRIPRTMSEIVLRALEKDPSRRIQSVQALQAALVAELKNDGQSSVELLLDSRQMRRRVDADQGEDAATRDEVERYERKLRRRSYVAWAALAAVVLAAGAFATRAYAQWTAPPTFQGRELEPNDSASTATAVPFPFRAAGVLGKRLDAERSDRDFYRVSVPANATLLSLSTTAVPTMGLCTVLYPAGSEEPFGRYCPGGPSRPLVVGALKVPAGDYFVAVMQDRDPYTEAGAPPVIESISDEYELRIGPGELEGEVEPNDFPRSASLLDPGRALSGRLAWMRDVDVFCSSDPARPVRFRVTDAVDRARPRSAVLQVLPRAGDDLDVPVRVHRAGTKLERAPRDVSGVWQSTPMAPTPAQPACIELSLVPNPWAPTPHPLVAPAGEEQYRVELVAL